MGILRVENISKNYGEVKAVNGIDFSVNKGEIFGFLGPNGAGKTTTINMIIGLSKPTCGEITIDGIEIKKHPKKAQAIMGVIADESNLYGDLSGFANLCFCASLYGMRKKEREEKARQLLEQFDLSKTGKRPFRAYSKGMKRKLTIAAGLIHSPQILFLDEPTTGIDVESARQIRDLIVDLKKQGTTIFLTTHYIEDAERICDRIAFIVDGSIVALGTVEELMQSVTLGHTVQLMTHAEISNEIVQGLQENFDNVSIINNERSISIFSENRISLLSLMQFLDKRGIEVYETKELKPSLEDVFVKVTGIEKEKIKKMRAGGVQ